MTRRGKPYRFDQLPLVPPTDDTVGRGHYTQPWKLTHTFSTGDGQLSTGDGQLSTGDLSGESALPEDHATTARSQITDIIDGSSPAPAARPDVPDSVDITEDGPAHIPAQ